MRSIPRAPMAFATGCALTRPPRATLCRARRTAHEVIVQHRPAAEQHGGPFVLVVQAEPAVTRCRGGVAGAGILPEAGTPALPVLPVPFGPLTVDGDGRRRYTVAQIAAEFGVTRPTIYRHLSPATAATTR